MAEQSGGLAPSSESRELTVLLLESSTARAGELQLSAPSSINPGGLWSVGVRERDGRWFVDVHGLRQLPWMHDIEDAEDELGPFRTPVEARDALIRRLLAYVALVDDRSLAGFCACAWCVRFSATGDRR